MTVRLRLPVSGRDVYLVPSDGRSDMVAAECGLDLAGALAVCQSRACQPDGDVLDVAALPIADIDFIVAQLRLLALGDRVVGEGACDRCGSRVDISFSLGAFLQHHRPRYSGVSPAEPQVWWALDRWPVEFRALTASDLLGLVPLGQGEARRSALGLCVRGDRTARSDKAVEAAMARVAPLLNTDVAGQCPECETTVTLALDVRSFCLRELAERARSVLADTVVLAAVLHWGEDEILALPSRRREAYVAMLASGQPALAKDALVA